MDKVVIKQKQNCTPKKHSFHHWKYKALLHHVVFVEPQLLSSSKGYFLQIWDQIFQIPVRISIHLTGQISYYIANA